PRPDYRDGTSGIGVGLRGNGALALLSAERVWTEQHIACCAHRECPTSSRNVEVLLWHTSPNIVMH
ncbi:MAG TPA: hypothetical protein VIV60_20555, partial [Polyangiaceae bacterium]